MLRGALLRGALLCALSLGSELAATPSCNQKGIRDEVQNYCTWRQSLKPRFWSNGDITYKCEDCPLGQDVAKTCGNAQYMGYEGHCCASHSCAWCPDGQYRDSSMKQCTCTGIGYTQAVGRASRVLCSPGHGAENCGPCEPCASFRTSMKGDLPTNAVQGSADSKGCFLCHSNVIPNNARTACVSCNMELGEFSYSWDSTCRYCKAGQYRTLDNTNTYVCRDCPAGKYSAQERAMDCVPCYAGMYQPNPGKAGCDTCKGTVHNDHTVCCNPTQYWYDTEKQCKKQLFAKLELIGENLVIVDSDTLDGKALDSNEYLVFGPNMMTKARCGECTSFEYKVSCSPIKDDDDVKSLIVKIGETSLSVMMWESQGKLKSELVAGTLVRSGACAQCTHCDKGFYLQNCNVAQGRGNCFPCRQACVDKNSYLVHSSQLGCGNVYAFEGDKQVVIYQARADYGCATCYVWRHTDFDKYILLVGCAGAEAVVRWHPTGEVDAAGLLRVSTCVLEGGTSNPAHEECYYNGVQFSSKSEVVYPSGPDLLAQAFTQTMPYCPPGWRVDPSCASLNSQNYGNPWDPACCKRCAACALGEAQAVEWEQCDGMSIVDTQICVTACAVGQFKETVGDVPESSNTSYVGGVCQPCKTCQ